LKDQISILKDLHLQVSEKQQAQAEKSSLRFSTLMQERDDARSSLSDAKLNIAKLTRQLDNYAISKQEAELSAANMAHQIKTEFRLEDSKWKDNEVAFEKLEGQVASLEAELAATTSSANEKGAALDDALSKLKESESVISDLNDQLKSERLKGEAPSQGGEAYVQKLRDQISSLWTDLAAANEAADKNAAQADKVRREKEELETLRLDEEGYVQKLRDQISSLWTDLAAANEAADKNAAQADKVRREKEVLETLKEKLLSDLDKLGTEKEDTEKEKSQLASNVVTLLSELEESKLQADASKAELARVVAEAHENKLDQEEQLATLLKEECMKQILVIGGYKNFKRANSSCGNAVEAADHEQGEERSQDEPIFC